MTDALRLRRWRVAALLVLSAWLIAVLVLNGAGHLSIDSLVQIAEGESGIKASYNPVFITVVFGKLAALGGPRLLVLCASLLLFAALMVLLPGTEQPLFAGVVVLAAAVAGPILVIYPAIVWKDVWLAHFALLGFAAIALRQRVPRLVAEGAALLLFASVMLTRQGGLIIALCGVGALAWARCRDEALRGPPLKRAASLITTFASRIVVLAVLALALGAIARLGLQEDTAGELATGARILVLYDVAGVVAHETDPDLSALTAHGFDSRQLLTQIRATYTGERIDKIANDWQSPMWSLPATTVAAIWFAEVTAHPTAYLRHRAETFAWLLGFRKQSLCAPIWLGYAEPEFVAKAGVTNSPSPYISRLERYSARFVGTPYFSPAAWALVSVVVLGFMAVRRRFDPVMTSLQVAGLVYLGHFFFVSIACDFRFAYFSVLASTVGLVWLAAGGARRTIERAPLS